MLRDFLVGVPRAIVDSFRGRNIVWHVLAIVLTYMFVVSSFDWWFFESTRNEALRPIVIIAGLGGFLVPTFLPVVLWIFGLLRKDRYALRTGFAVAQAAIVAWLISSTYKVFTGRIQPEFHSSSLNNAPYSLTDISHQFNFGFLEHGIFWGWPSSHATVAFATAITLFLLYRSKALRFIVILWALVVGLGAAIGFHWFSDVVAGAIIGTVIGIVVAHRYKR